jgi:hypothetical protein
MKVLVCGSRTYDYPKVVYDVLNHYAPDVVIHGGATGADQSAHRWARRHNAIEMKFEADWKTHGKKAGPLRNQAMIDEAPDQVLAFVDKPLEKSIGTRSTVRMAERAGIPVRIFGPPRLTDGTPAHPRDYR